MAEQNHKELKTAENMLSDNTTRSRDFEQSRDKRKPQAQEIYRPGMGFSRRNDGNNEGWRNSKSPSPYPNDFKRKPTNTNKYRNRPDVKQQNREEAPRPQYREETPKNVSDGLKNLTISTDTESLPVIDLTVSPTGDEKKKMKKPEKAIYVPKASLDRLKTRSDVEVRSEQNCTKGNVSSANGGEGSSSNVNVSKSWEGVANDNLNKNKPKRKSKQRNRRESVEKDVIYNKREFQRSKITPQKEIGVDVVNDGSKRQQNHEEAYYPNKEKTKERANFKNASSQEINSTQEQRKPDMSNNKTETRDLRQTSEPRNLPPYNKRNQRDTRSMEHSNWQEKMPLKPPVGRRGSGTIINKLDSLPPRFKKKYLEGMAASQASSSGASTTYIGTASEEPWNGDSLSFNSSHSNYPVQYRVPYQVQQYHWSQNQRMRVPLEDEQAKMTQSLPPDQLLKASSPYSSRPTTPSQESLPVEMHQTLPFRSVSTHERLNHVDGRGRGRNKWRNQRKQYEDRPQWQKNTRQELDKRYDNSKSNGLDRKHNQVTRTSFVKDETSEASKISSDNTLQSSHPGSPDTQSAPIKPFDWSEEVEESERLEKEALSRSSSLASLQQTTMQPPSDRHRNIKRNVRKDRSVSRESGYRNNSHDRNSSQERNYRSRQSEENMNRNRDINKGYYGFRRTQSRESSRDRTQNKSRDNSRERNKFDWRRGGEDLGTDWRREGRKSEERKDIKNWREEFKKDEKAGGIIVLPVNQDLSVPPPPITGQRGYSNNAAQRQLFDPNNPNRPIIVSPSSSRVNASKPGDYNENQINNTHAGGEQRHNIQMYHNPNAVNSQQIWYEQTHESTRQRKCNAILSEISKIEIDIQNIIQNTTGIQFREAWPQLHYLRQIIKDHLKTLSVTDIKLFYQDHIEQHIWKLTYHNIIEHLKRLIAEDVAHKEFYKNLLIGLIEEGVKYFEELVQFLESTYEFKVEDYLSCIYTKPAPFLMLAILLAQKFMCYIGDLTRYKEVVNETTNFGKAKLWYTKAQQINPKNGRPFYQLALIAYLGRRKFDAVYFYMRSLMASNPLPSARESLVSIFDESRKKYESIERKRKEERESKYKEKVKEKESESVFDLRREIWIHPSGRRRVHRTTSTSTDSRRYESEDEELSNLLSNDINKRFTTSFLHVHGKLFSKVGLETFPDTSLQMLREFRALLQHSPLPINSTRFLQLLALNMYAIDNTQLKDKTNLEGYRSAAQENALVISIQMFNLILERCLILLREQLQNPVDLKNRLVSDDVQVLLPAIKVWCDWLLCHTSIWNPPPCCSDYRVGPSGDAWSRLASLVNHLDKLEYKKMQLFTQPSQGVDLIKLPEDITLAGFPPLMSLKMEPIYTSVNSDMELAQCCLRISKILFFGTVFLCGVEPPVVKLLQFDGFHEFVSVVDAGSRSRASSTDNPNDSELLLESFSENEEYENEKEKYCVENLEPVTNKLLLRKAELEKIERRDERVRKNVKDRIEHSGIKIIIEVKPKYVVPDTNCFIDYLPMLKKIASVPCTSMEPVYILAVPLIVLSELEGLSRGCKERDPSELSLVEQARMMTLSENSKTALAYLRSPTKCMPTLKCVTTTGKFLTSFTPFNVNEEVDKEVQNNDDKILKTCISLCKIQEQPEPVEGSPRRVIRDVVLLTEDRHLRLRAMNLDLPVREAPDFTNWAGLG